MDSRSGREGRGCSGLPVPLETVSPRKGFASAGDGTMAGELRFLYLSLLG